MARYECQNCGELWKESELNNVGNIPDLAQRVEPGEPMPMGECPSEDCCGALCHEHENEGCLEGMECVKCGSVGPFKIEVKVLRLVHDDGSTEDDKMSGDTEWVSDDYCECEECGHSATVKDFTKKGGEDLEPAHTQGFDQA